MLQHLKCFGFKQYKKAKRKIYKHSTGIVAEQFKISKLKEVIEWLDKNIGKYKWTLFTDSYTKTYWKDVDEWTQVECNTVDRFYFLNKKDAATFKMFWG